MRWCFLKYKQHYDGLCRGKMLDSLPLPLRQNLNIQLQSIGSSGICSQTFFTWFLITALLESCNAVTLNGFNAARSQHIIVKHSAAQQLRAQTLKPNSEVTHTPAYNFTSTCLAIIIMRLLLPGTIISSPWVCLIYILSVHPSKL